MSKPSQYVYHLLPPSAEIGFLYRADFNQDTREETILGFTSWEHFPPVSAVYYIYHQGTEPAHRCLLTNIPDHNCLYDEKAGIAGIIDNIFVADTTGNGNPDLIVALTSGNGHFVTPYVLHWQDTVPVLVWKEEKSFYHGSLRVEDVDLDGIYEIIIEESVWYEEGIFSLSEASPHMRLATLYKWDGKTYRQSSYLPLDPTRTGHNISMEFLASLATGNYARAYELVQLPLFLGVEGLDDSSLPAFKKYVDEKILPFLQANLQAGRLTPVDFGYFTGKRYNFTFQWYNDQGKTKIKSILID